MYFSKSLVVMAAGLLSGAAAAGKGGQGQAAQASAAAAAQASAAAAQAAAGNNGATATQNQGASGLALDASVVQTASASVGNVNVTAGESKSATSTNNFINFCQGKTLTNGLQIQGGSCNGIVMGDIPASNKMVSTIIVNPPAGGNIAANTDFTLQAQTANLAAGTFTNAASTYYSASQQLSSSGIIVGHMHFTVQSLQSMTQATPPDPAEFAFFKGVDDAGNGQGLLSATITGGLPAGTYRVCTLSSAANHQPVIMPVAQRGAQDDCQKFTVGGNGGNGATASTNANAGAAAATQGQGNAAASQAAAAAAAKGQGNAAKGQGNAAAAQAANGKGGANRGRQRGRFARREFIA